MHQNIELPLPSSKRLWESPQEGFPLQYSSGAIFGWKENPDQGKGWELYQPSEYVGAGGPLFWLMNATHPNTPKDLQEALWASSEFETLCRWVLKDVDPELVAKRCDRHGGYYTPIVDLLRGCIQRGWVGGSR